MLAVILAYVGYVRWGIVALMAIVAMILSSADAGSWPFWVTLAIFVGVAWLFLKTPGKIFTGGWKIAMTIGMIFLCLVVFFRVWPVATSAVSSWWGSAKAVVASSTGGQQAPAVDMATPVLPTSQVVATTTTATVAQPVVVAQGCPPGYVCVPEQMVAQQQTAVASPTVQPSSQRGGGKSMSQLMREASSEEALSMSRRLSGDGQ